MGAGLLTALVSGPIRSWTIPQRATNALTKSTLQGLMGVYIIYPITTLSLTLPPWPNLTEDPYLVL